MYFPSSCAELSDVKQKATNSIALAAPLDDFAGTCIRLCSCYAMTLRLCCKNRTKTGNRTGDYVDFLLLVIWWLTSQTSHLGAGLERAAAHKRRGLRRSRGWHSRHARRRLQRLAVLAPPPSPCNKERHQRCMTQQATSILRSFPAL